MNQIEEKALRKWALRNYAMMCGTVLGVVWLVRFIVFLMGLRFPLVMTLFACSVVLTPILLVSITRQYRDTVWKGTLSRIDGLQLNLLTCFYASLLMAAVHFIYFRFIDHGFVAEAYEAMGDMLKQLPEASESGLTATFDEAMDLWRDMSPVNVALQMMANNFFWGAIVSVPVALCLYGKPKDNNE